MSSLRQYDTWSALGYQEVGVVVACELVFRPYHRLHSESRFCPSDQHHEDQERQAEDQGQGLGSGALEARFSHEHVLESGDWVNHCYSA